MKFTEDTKWEELATPVQEEKNNREAMQDKGEGSEYKSCIWNARANTAGGRGGDFLHRAPLKALLCNTGWQ